MTTPYHNHRGDMQMVSQHKNDAALLVACVLIVVAFLLGCWLGYVTGYNKRLREESGMVTMRKPL
jgi:Kef-type K+ transport system membrane component KefB